MIPRSWLFVPGGDAEKLAKAFTKGADALIVDLEDAVPPGGKQAARETVATWLSTGDGERVWVRGNNDPHLVAADIEMAVGGGSAGVVVPKVRDTRQAAAIASLIEEAEREAGRDRDSVGLIPMIETPTALLEATGIAGVPRVVTLMLGEYDLIAELGAEHTEGSGLLARCRSDLVLACGAAGRRPPLGPVSADFTDLEGFRASTERLKWGGHLGRAVIHPDQVAIVNDVFTPTTEAVARARRRIEVHEAAQAQNRAVTVDDDGRLLDEPMVRMSRRVLEMAPPADER